MSLTDLYYLKEDEVTRLHLMFAESFYTDDLYCALFKDGEKREKFLRFFFKHYIHMIQPFCHFVAESSALQSVMVVFDSTLENRHYIPRVVWLNAKMMMMILCLHSWKGISHTLACWDMFTSRWVKDFVTGEYLHLDLLATRKEAQGKGLATVLIQQLVDEANMRHCDITMETHHNENLTLYEKEGFKLMSEITHENYDLTQYNLLLRAERGTS